MVLNLLYFYISTFRSMCAVPNMAVFCSFIIIIIVIIIIFNMYSSVLYIHFKEFYLSTEWRAFGRFLFHWFSLWWSGSLEKMTTPLTYNPEDREHAVIYFLGRAPESIVSRRDRISNLKAQCSCYIVQGSHGRLAWLIFPFLLICKFSEIYLEYQVPGMLLL